MSGAYDLIDRGTTNLTQGGLPHLMDYLWAQFLKHIQAQINARKKAKKPTVELAEATTKVGAYAFKEFCDKFLARHRAVENHFVDNNIGFRLSNNDLVALSPGVEIAGTMQDSGAIAITHGRSQTGLDGVEQSDSISI